MDTPFLALFPNALPRIRLTSCADDRTGRVPSLRVA
jgi:hypothetical protein